MGFRDVGEVGNGYARLIALAALCLGIVLCAPAAASAKTFYTQPGATAADTCTEVDPCRLEKAVAAAEAGDSVSVGGSEYQLSDLPSTPIQITKAIDIGGEVGSRPLISTDSLKYLQVIKSAGPKARVHDLSFAGTGSLLVEAGTVERVYVSTSSSQEVVAEPPAACVIKLDNSSPTVTIRDSVCWSNEIYGPSTAAGLRISVDNDGPEKVAHINNVDAIADGSTGDALEAFAGGNAKVRVEGKNVIARSINGKDVAAVAAEPKGLARVIVSMRGSNYGTVRDLNGAIDVTDPGTEGNLTALPQFVDGPDGDFREAETSPTLDAGVDDELNGSTDINGAGRSQPSCLGPNGKALPDAGAYERSPLGECSAIAPPPPPPPEPPKPQFRILQLKINKQTGSGSVRLEVPGPGIASVTGSGVKFLRRTAAAAGQVTLPIEPWAITLVRLNKLGKQRIKLRLKFEPTGPGVQRQKALPILLKRHRKPA